MKGFTKGKGKGKKFIPTSKKKSALSSKDIRKKITIVDATKEPLVRKHDGTYELSANDKKKFDAFFNNKPQPTLPRDKQSLDEMEGNDHLKKLQLYDGKTVLLSPEGFTVARKKINELANEFRDKAEGKSDSEKAHLYLVEFQKKANELSDEIEKEHPPKVNGRVVKEGEHGLEFDDSRSKKTLTEAESNEEIAKHGREMDTDREVHSNFHASDKHPKDLDFHTNEGKYAVHTKGDRSSRAPRNKQSLKKGDPRCTQCGYQQKTKGKCDYCGCKGSYC